MKCSDITTCLVSGCTATVMWAGDVSWFLNAIFNVVMVFHMETQQKLLLPSYFIKLVVNFERLEHAKIGTVLVCID